MGFFELFLTASSLGGLFAFPVETRPSPNILSVLILRYDLGHIAVDVLAGHGWRPEVCLHVRCLASVALLELVRRVKGLQLVTSTLLSQLNLLLRVLLQETLHCRPYHVEEE